MSVKFYSENGIGGKIERISVIFFTASGTRYAYGMYGVGETWTKIEIIIPEKGTSSYSTMVRTKFNTPQDLRNGRVEIAFEGYDLNGNRFDGKVTARLLSN